ERGGEREEEGKGGGEENRRGKRGRNESMDSGGIEGRKGRKGKNENRRREGGWEGEVNVVSKKYGLKTIG
ncbi:hypothetical protein ACQJ1P_26595, partial [Klebsiella pneumoniae]|uniref:hypothetical protein n=1 Tax=Klebsiella pneumoniae TaxID=573 RepID=UPI003CFF61A0